MDRNKGLPLSEEQLEAAAGGVSTADMEQVKEWNAACSSYECKLCGMRGADFFGHAEGCGVKAFPNPYAGNVALLGYVNSCWSCKYAVQGKNFPADRNDLYCGHGH